MKEGDASNEPSQERQCWAPFSKCLIGCGCMQVGARVLFQHICCCASMCQSACGSKRGNRWEVCHVLVNKSVIVLFCPAWLTVSCVGSTPFPLNPEALTCMPAHTYLTHPHTQTNSRTHPIMRTKTDSVLHWLVACNWIGTSSVIFPIWWPDAPQWGGICCLVQLPWSRWSLWLAQDMARRVERYTYCPSLLHTGLLYSQSHTVPQDTQFCNTTQQQYSLKLLAVYFLKGVKSST